MKSELIKAIKAATAVAVKHGTDYVSVPTEANSVEELITIYGELQKFIGYERGFNDAVRGTDTYGDE
jgi:hypothetical protein